VGAVGQRTRAYGGDREFQRGPFVPVTFGRATLGGFWFNPGSNDQVFVGSIGVTFQGRKRTMTDIPAAVVVEANYR